MVSAVIAAFLYLRVIVAMYLTPTTPTSRPPAAIRVPSAPARPRALRPGHHRRRHRSQRARRPGARRACPSWSSRRRRRPRTGTPILDRPAHRRAASRPRRAPATDLDPLTVAAALTGGAVAAVADPGPLSQDRFRGHTPPFTRLGQRCRTQISCASTSRSPSWAASHWSSSASCSASSAGSCDPTVPRSRSTSPTRAASTPSAPGWSQSQIRYYIFALLFVMFDVEAVFIFPWAIAPRGVRHLRPRRDGRLHRHPRPRPRSTPGGRRSSSGSSRERQDAEAAHQAAEH